MGIKRKLVRHYSVDLSESVPASSWAQKLVSGHANKRLARLLIAWKLEQQQQENSAALKSQRRMFHHQIERGNPRRTFTGMAFIEG